MDKSVGKGGKVRPAYVYPRLAFLLAGPGGDLLERRTEMKRKPKGTFEAASAALPHPLPTTIMEACPAS